VQALRAIAALLVVFVHLSGSSGFEARYLGGSSWFSWLNLSGNTGVDLFFVISGLIMTVTTWRTFGAPGSPQRFLWRRVTRIYPLYWLITTPILALYLVSPDSVNSHADHPPSIVASYLLLPQQGLPLLLVGWTLVYEMYFYLLFALGMLLGRRWFGWLIGAWAAVTVILHLTVGSTDNPFLGLVSSLLSLEFVFGVVIGYAIVHGRIVYPVAVLTAGVLAVAGLFSYLGRSGLHDFPSEAFRVFGPGLAMALVVYGAVGLETRHELVAPGFLQRWGDASYSLYLIHVPMLTALGMVLAKLVSPGPVLHVVGIVAVPAALIVAARLSYRLIEHPLQKFFHRWPARRPATEPVVGSLPPDATVGTDPAVS
jgi:peptidoglycan/LPS O-acetylase OafA/YrhL